jgi:DNA polymerase-3 subunit epsilon
MAIVEVEIACIELENHLPTGRHFHKLVDPEMEVPAEAVAVHGLSNAKLKGAPLFAAIAIEFLEFIGDSKLVIHNADFDMGFINAELVRANLPKLPNARALDTVQMARRKFPGSPASLDALCKRFGIDNAHRTLHGALLDSELLAEVYLAMTRGQDSFEIALDAGDGRADGAEPIEWPPRGLAVKAASPAEVAAHEAALAAIGKERKGQALWIMAPSQPA